jgi:subfamily B ATP-binding cassette protein MsbA
VVAAEDVFTLLDDPAEDDAGTVERDRVMGRISIRNLDFRYPGGDTDVLHRIELEIEPGQMVALVGHSGSGKSTLVSLIQRFYDAPRGTIFIDDVDVRDFRLKSLRRQMALVNQQVALFNDTIASNIAYGQSGALDEARVWAAADAAFASEFIKRQPEGIQTLVGENGLLLSGGQRQRLAIARALFKDAPILILDEATSALDTESERYIQAALETVMKGRTTLVIAHRLSTVERADRIVVMDRGRIVETGTHTELLARGGIYSKLHGMQLEG